VISLPRPLSRPEDDEIREIAGVLRSVLRGFISTPGLVT
jgi:hypothetical protein